MDKTKAIEIIKSISMECSENDKCEGICSIFKYSKPFECEELDY